MCVCIVYGCHFIDLLVSVKIISAIAFWSSLLLIVKHPALNILKEDRDQRSLGLHVDSLLVGLMDSWAAFHHQLSLVIYI